MSCKTDTWSGPVPPLNSSISRHCGEITSHLADAIVARTGSDIGTSRAGLGRGSRNVYDSSPIRGVSDVRTAPRGQRLGSRGHDESSLRRVAVHPPPRTVQAPRSLHADVRHPPTLH